MKTLTKIALAFVALTSLSFGQVILSSTTLGAAITTLNGTSLTLASTSTMQNQGTANQINTCLYIDAEVFGVVTVVDSTHVTVQQRGRGCGGLGLSSRPMTHANAATVYFALTVTNGSIVTPAATYIGRNEQVYSENVGTCTAANELALPRIYLYSGDVFDCLGGQWIQVNKPGFQRLGSVVASVAGVITPTGNVFHVSGALAITGITVPNGWQPGMSISVIPDGTFTWTTATNIALAGTAVVNKLIIFVWSGSKWVPSVIA